jgi:cytochrome c1
MKTAFEIKDKTKLTEELKIAPFKQQIRKTSPHKHRNYFEIIYLTKGKGTHTIDSKEYKIKTPVVFTMQKALEKRDTIVFNKNFKILTNSCISCHAMEKVPYFTVKKPLYRQSPIRK